MPVLDTSSACIEGAGDPIALSRHIYIIQSRCHLPTTDGEHESNNRRIRDHFANISSAISTISLRTFNQKKNERARANDRSIFSN